MSGDMFDVGADIIVNTVNCVGVMGCGVAAKFKQRYPKMYKEYRRECTNGKIFPGVLWNYLNDGDGVLIVNFPTKDHWRNPSKYSYISNGLKALRSFLEKKGDFHISVAIPALGCGHGGLDWDIVSDMIKESLGDLQNATVYVFNPQASKNFEE